jgi:uncharacterized protein (TIGR03437 family)
MSSTTLQTLRDMLIVRATILTLTMAAFVPVLFPLPCLAAPRRAVGNQVPTPVANRSVHAIGRYPGSTFLEVAVGLPLKDNQGLQAFIDDIYNPASPNYKRYLTVEEFTERFGPTAADYSKVIDFLKSSGLTVTTTTPNRMVVDAAGSVSDFERVFQFTMRTYPHPSESREFRAPDVEPSVPADIPILDIMGLDDYMQPRRMDAKASPSDIVASITGSGPGGTWTSGDLRAAYAPGVNLNGAGQSIGLFELGVYSADDITQFEKASGLPNVPVVNITLNGVSGIWTPGYGGGEEALDVEMALAMAPGVSQILVYEGANPGDIMNRMATDNAAKQLSCSWGFLPAPSTLQQILMEYAAQGQSFLHSSGDGGAWTTRINAPGGNPYTTEVGGTDLVTTGPGGAWLSETAWRGSGGGVATDLPIPSWQTKVSMTANMGSTTSRNFPDVAIVGNATLFTIIDGRAAGTGGTSASAPLWAGFVALANQQAASATKRPVGFLNPTVYALGLGSDYLTDFHDITTGNNINDKSPNLYYAVPGYDLTTGWGTPAGQNLINGLVGDESASPGFGISALPYQINALQGSSAVTTISVSPYGAFSNAVSLTLTGLPAGVTASFSPSSTATTTMLTLNVAASVPARAYVGTVEASSGSMNQTTAIVLNVTAPVTPDFTISASPSIVNVLPGQAVQSTIAIRPAGTFSNPVTLSATGVPKGVTASFSPATASGSSTLILSASNQAGPGTYTIGISASSGNLKHSSTLGLLVRGSGRAPVAVDLSATYNVTGIASDGAPFPAGFVECCAYSADLLGSSVTVDQTVPFLFGPPGNGLAPVWNAIEDGSGPMTVRLPQGQFGSIELLAAARGNQQAQKFQINYAGNTSTTFTQSVSDWNTPQSYPGETSAASLAYTLVDSGAKVNRTAYLYNYSFNLDNCKNVSSLTLPANGNLETLAVTLVPGLSLCTTPAVLDVEVADGRSSIAQNTFVEIYGLNLAPPSVPAGGVDWSSAPEFAQGLLPRQLAGVSVTVDGKPAYVYYVSRGQVNVLTPLDSKTGSVPIVVTSGSSVSESFNVELAALAPAFALAGGTRYLASTHGNGTYVGPVSLGPAFLPAAPGEEIVLYGFGFGLPGGASLVAGSSRQTGNLPENPQVQIGGQTAQVDFAGLISPGLYQFNVVVPPTAASGDNAITAVYNKVPISTLGYISVQGSH